MNFKKIFVFTIILLAICCISAVSAEDIADDSIVNTADDVDSDDIVSTDISEDNIVQENSSSSSIVSSDLIKYYKNDTQYEAAFYDSEGNPLVNQSIPIEINGAQYTRVTNSSGIMRMSINLNPGEFVIKVTNPVTKETALNNITVLSTLLSSDVEKYFRNGTQFYVTVLDGQGKALASTDVEFNINGVFYNRTTNKNGTARLNINLNPNKYVITTKGPDGLLIANNVTVKSTITGKDIKKYYRNATQYYANFTDNKGNPLANANVTFNINGVFYNRTTNENGTARLNINLNPGKYVLTAINLNTTEQISNTVEVLSKIVVKNSQSGGNISMEYNTRSKYSVTVYNDDGSLAKNKNVSFNINGVLYNRQSDENGTAFLTINLVPGNYIITTDFEGSKVSNLIKVRITPSIKLVSSEIKYEQPIQFYLSEKNSGNPITGQHYGIIYFNGTGYGAYPDETGLVSIGQNLPVGFSDIFYFATIDDGYYSEVMVGNTIRIVE